MIIKSIGDYTLKEIRAYCEDYTGQHNGEECDVCEECKFNVVCAMTPEEWGFGKPTAKDMVILQYLYDCGVMELFRTEHGLTWSGYHDYDGGILPEKMFEFLEVGQEFSVEETIKNK